jgi:hypothetical protein
MKSCTQIWKTWNLTFKRTNLILLVHQMGYKLEKNMAYQRDIRMKLYGTTK